MNDIAQIMSWVVTIVGLVGFYFAGQKKWWCWYINIFCQFLWTIYAIVSNQPAFLLSVVVYSFIFGRNAYRWTKEHREKEVLNYFVNKFSSKDVVDQARQINIDRILQDAREGKLTINQVREKLGYPPFNGDFADDTEYFTKRTREALARERIEYQLKYPKEQTVFRKAPDRTRINEELARNWGKDGASNIRRDSQSE